MEKEESEEMELRGFVFLGDWMLVHGMVAAALPASLHAGEFGGTAGRGVAGGEAAPRRRSR